MSWAAVAAAAGAVISSSMSSDAASSAANSSAQGTATSNALQKYMYDTTAQRNAPWTSAGGASVNKLAQMLGLDVSNLPGFTPDASTLRANLLPQFTHSVAASGAQGYFSGDADNPTVWHPSTYTPETSTIDEGGLNAAIQAALDSYKTQQTSNASNADFGSLIKPFSMSDYQADPGYQFRLDQGMKGVQNSAAARGGLLSGAALKGIAGYNQDAASQEYQNAYNRFQSNQTNQFNRLAAMAGLGQTANNSLAQSGSNYANSVSGLNMTNAANQGNAALAAAQQSSSAYQGIGNALGRAYGTNNTSGYGYYPATYAASQGQVYGPQQQ